MWPYWLATRHGLRHKKREAQSSQTLVDRRNEIPALPVSIKVVEWAIPLGRVSRDMRYDEECPGQ